MKYGFNDIMLDIIGYIMIGLSIWKLFTLNDLTIAKSTPYLLISTVGIIFIAFTIKKVATKLWTTGSKFLKDKVNNEKDN